MKSIYLKIYIFFKYINKLKLIFILNIEYMYFIYKINQKILYLKKY